MPVLEKVPGIQFSGGTKVLASGADPDQCQPRPSLAGYQIASACYFKKLLILLRENCNMSLHFIVRD